MNKKDVTNATVNNQAVIDAIKNYITHRFNNMTYDEYEDMCYGTGTLGVCDEAIEKYDVDCELNESEIAELVEYCDKESTQFEKRFGID